MLPELKATLCPPKLADTAGPELAALLESLGGELRLLACWYNGPRLAASRPFVAGEVRTPDTRWTSEIRTTPVAGEPGALDLAITFKLAEGISPSEYAKGLTEQS